MVGNKYITSKFYSYYEDNITVSTRVNIPNLTNQYNDCIVIFIE